MGKKTEDVLRGTSEKWTNLKNSRGGKKGSLSKNSSHKARRMHEGGPDGKTGGKKVQKQPPVGPQQYVCPSFQQDMSLHQGKISKKEYRRVASTKKKRGPYEARGKTGGGERRVWT